MSTESNKLRQMIQVAPGQVEEIGNSIGQIDEQIADVTTEIEAIENGMCEVAESTATLYLETVVAPDKGGYMYYGPDYGQISWDPLGSLEDWEVRDSTSHAPIYTYVPGDYPDLDELVDDFEFGNDYLTRPLTTGASYGLKPTKANLQFAKSILEENQDKVANSETAFSKYAS